MFSLEDSMGKLCDCLYKSAFCLELCILNICMRNNCGWSPAYEPAEKKLNKIPVCLSIVGLT